jgi:uncharacterized membrane protein
MEGFSDGVFGFAITLLVIDWAVRPPGTALEQLLNAGRRSWRIWSAS